MHSAVQVHQAEVVKLCRRFGVTKLVLFGSAARDDFDPASSDFDFLVEFADVSSPGYADRYLDFAQALEGVFKCPVDLLTSRSVVNPLFAQAIKRDRIELYAA